MIVFFILNSENILLSGKRECDSTRIYNYCKWYDGVEHIFLNYVFLSSKEGFDKIYFMTMRFSSFFVK